MLAGREGRRRAIVATDMAALRAGLRVGMPATKAQALVADLIVRDADPAGDLAALERLAAWVLRYSPIVAPDPPDGLVLDIAGAIHLHGGETAMLADVVRRLSEAGIRAHAALAGTWGAAHALARFGGARTVAVSNQAEEAALMPLPIAALRLRDETIDGLRRLGFETIDDLANTPRAPLALRFGPEPGRRLDQAMGRRGEPIDPLRPADAIEVRRSFAEPIGAAETIARYVGKLTVRLAAELERRGLGARRLDLVFVTVDNRVEAVRVGTARPVRDVKRLTRLLCDRIETVDPGFGIEVMRLAATLAEPFETAQIVSSLAAEPGADVSGLLDVLANRLGEGRLYRCAPVVSDVPERSVRRIGAAAPAVGEGWPKGWPRPARLLAPPERIETVALLPDRPPVNFTWRGVRRRVRRADGPERVFGEWWKRDAELTAVRDYFQVEDDAGERFWIYRAGDGEDARTGSHRWYMHGIFA